MSPKQTLPQWISIPLLEQEKAENSDFEEFGGGDIMSKKAVKFFIATFCLALRVLTACGREEYVVEYGVDGYVYLSERLYSMDDVSELNIFGEDLYLTRDGGNRIFVERISVPSLLSGGEKLNFSKKKEVLALKAEPFVLPEDALEVLETYDFSDMVLGKGASGWDPSEEHRVYCTLSLTGFAADREQNLYYTLGITAGTLEEMEVLGELLCRRTAEGELSYWKYLPKIRNIAVDGQGRVCVLAEKDILVYDKEGNRASSVSVEACQSGSSGLEELFMDSEGRVYYCVRGGNYEWKSYELVLENGSQLKDAGGFLGSYTRHAAALGGDVLLFSLDSSDCLYRYSREEKKVKELLRWPDSGIMGSYVRSVVEIAPDILLVCYGDTMSRSLYQLTRTSADQVPERVTLVLASVSNGSAMQNAVTGFNKTNEKYHIVIGDYGAQFTSNGVVSPMLDAAFVSSNPPDLIDLGFLDISKFADQGGLEDLSPYLDNSGILNREDYLDNVLEGMTIDGKLVCIPATFDLRAIVGRASQIRDLDGWSMEDVYRLTDAHPESKAGLISSESGEMEQREYFLKTFCSAYYLEKFVDWDSLECNFDCGEFRRLLAWAGDYAWEPEVKVEQVGPIFLDWEYIPETALLASLRYLKFDRMKLLEFEFGEEPMLLGFPTVDGKGTYSVRVGEALAIHANSPHKEAAWEFIEYYLSKQGRSFIDNSTRKDHIQEDYEFYTTPEDSSAEKEGSTTRMLRIFQIGQDVLSYDVIPKEQADAVLHAIETADFEPLSTTEKMIINIVAEEAEGYYAGDKSLEEVTEIIQNRAWLLLQEQKK